MIRFRRSNPPLFIPLILVCLSASAVAAADDLPLSILGRFPAICPVCRKEFTSIACTQTNARAGVDRDLFARAVGPQIEFYRISTCPRCGYSGYATDFDPDLKLPPDFVDKVLKTPRLKLPDGFTPESDPRELDASIRYELAITCYQWRQKSDEALGWLHLRAAWIAREEGSSLPRDGRLAGVLKYAERWRPPLQAGGNQLEVEMQLAARTGEAVAWGVFNRYQRPYVELALALILRRHGENIQAADLLDPLLAAGGFSDSLLEAMRRMRASIDDERRLQTRSAEHFERAVLAEQIAPANRGAALYLLGELNRRLGRDARAIAWYDRAVAAGGLDPELLAWAHRQRAACAAR